MMSFIHCRFRVIKHHIGSGSNPDLGLEVPHWLLNFVLLMSMFFRQNSYFLLLTQANGKCSFSLPRIT